MYNGIVCPMRIQTEEVMPTLEIIKPVYKFSPEGEFIKVYPDRRTAAVEAKLSYGAIGRVLRGKFYTAGGFRYSLDRHPLWELK